MNDLYSFSQLTIRKTKKIKKIYFIIKKLNILRIQLCKIYCVQIPKDVPILMPLR